MNDPMHDGALGLAHSRGDAEIAVTPSTISNLVSEPGDLGFSKLEAIGLGRFHDKPQLFALIHEHPADAYFERLASKTSVSGDQTLRMGVVPLVYIQRDSLDHEVVLAIRIRDDKYNDPQVIGQSVGYAMKVLGNAYTFIFSREKHATLLLVPLGQFEELYEFAADSEIRHHFFKSY
ncbi:MAG: hypothetical protein ACI8W8_004402 [Rhodothermales bacterium]|jgi:hypothetical protein